MKTYRHYFDIDPDYFPQVDEEIINESLDYWKKYYPHETFVKLIKDTTSVLDRSQKLSIWVEGAYGTGKSHSVLTLKKLIDAPIEESKAYFEKYGIDKDLSNRFHKIKSDEKQILTVHRYGSSSIENDNDLSLAVQESINQALVEKGIENNANKSIKESIIEYLSDESNKEVFNIYARDKYKEVFLGDDADAVLNKLNTYSDTELHALIKKILKIDELAIGHLNIEQLRVWIEDTIDNNNLKAILFIWDEFSEYFYNNKTRMTGFQRLAELSATKPFYFMIVTHKSTGLFSDVDKNAQKILNRFVEPTCLISLPENIAFQLMGAAMEKVDDEEIRKEWELYADDLYDRTRDSRKLVKENARIEDHELKNILPIHPYAALLLKHISSAFDANQRSMFNFIKNDKGDDSKGFQWFIDHHGPEEENPLLTIDMLWDFFYGNDKEKLSQDIKAILDYYPRAERRGLNNEQKRVLKAVLLLQAISQRVGDSVDLFIPNQKNIDNAFEGTDLEYGKAHSCAEALVRDEVIYKRDLGNGKFQYSAMISAQDTAAIEKAKKEIENNFSTIQVVSEINAFDQSQLPISIRQRFKISCVDVSNFDSIARSLVNNRSLNSNSIYVAIAFSKDDDEAALMANKIQEKVQLDEYKDIVFIDTSINPLGRDGLNSYIDNSANAMYQRNIDPDLANQYEINAKEALIKWKNKINNGEFLVYSQFSKEGIRLHSIEELIEQLRDINKKYYRDSLEQVFHVNESLYENRQLKLGVECGVNQSLTNQYKNANTKLSLDTALAGAWQVDEYWIESPNLYISKVKRKINEKIESAFNKDGRISIAEILNMLTVEPYGYMPCSLTAFILGFLLKEYVDGSYSWSDDLTSDVLSLSKLKDMIDEAIKNYSTPNVRYRDKYIVMMTKEEKAFNSGTSKAFNIQENLCNSIEQTRERIRAKLKDFVFPIWTISGVLSKFKLRTEEGVINELIDCYCGIANNENIVGARTESDIAQNIGRIFIKYKDASSDLRDLFSKLVCIEGMKQYVSEYEGGKLVQLANEIGDNGQYINVLKDEFDDVDAANWAWNKETTQQKISEVILNYEIISNSNKINGKVTTYQDTIKKWIEKCQYIKLSYDACKDSFGKLKPLLEMLYSIKLTGRLESSKKKYFLELLYSQGDSFKQFYSSQTDIFKTVFLDQLVGLSDQNIEELYKKLPEGLFIKDSGEYNNLITKNIKEFKSQLGITKLRQLWKEKTGTESPKEWSQKYNMPILIMVDDLLKARKCFGVINSNNPNNDDVIEATKFIKNATFFERMNNKDEREAMFKKCILKQYAVLLSIDEAVEYLKNNVSTNPYEWYLPQFLDKLSVPAKKAYSEKGVNEALSKIDTMQEDSAKKYLKQLIQGNMNVGIEIIKGE